VCANDQTALGAMHALARRGIRVPDDVAVTGFDDVPVARHLHPPLTTVRQPIKELGMTAFDVLYSRIGRARGQSEVVLPVQLIIRESCGCSHTPALQPGRPSVAGAEN
jgi:LacI family transcriptional regulator